MSRHGVPRSGCTTRNSGAKLANANCQQANANCCPVCTTQQQQGGLTQLESQWVPFERQAASAHLMLLLHICSCHFEMLQIFLQSHHPARVFGVDFTRASQGTTVQARHALKRLRHLRGSCSNHIHSFARKKSADERCSARASAAANAPSTVTAPAVAAAAPLSVRPHARKVARGCHGALGGFEAGH